MTAPADSARAALHEFVCAFEQFKHANDERLAALEGKRADVLLEEKVARIDQALDGQKQALDRLAAEASRPALTGSEHETRDAGWQSYVRRGDASALLEGKSLSAGSASDGGYVAPAQTEALITRLVTEVSPIRAISTVKQTTSHTFKRPISLGGAAAGWTAETGARDETDAASLSLAEIPTAEIYAMPAATPVLLEDALVDVDQWLAEEVRDIFAEEEGKAFISGNGTNKPKGFLDYTKVSDGAQNWGELGYLATGDVNDFPADDPADLLIDLIYAPASGYRANGRFVMNRRTVSKVRKFKDSDGAYIWQPGLSADQPATLMGYPVTEAEDMPDVAAGAFAVAFGDFERGYLVVDRQGVQVLRDPYSAKPYVLFYTTKRVGGGVQDFNAIKLLKFAVS
ncbi:MAG: phage major capsid protein [Pseudomonadota bacterium]